MSKLLFIMLLLTGSAASASQWPSGYMENKGQVHDQDRRPNDAVKYLLQARAMNVQLRQGGFSYDLYRDSVVPAEGGTVLPEGALSPAGRLLSEERFRSFHRIDVDFVGALPDAVFRGLDVCAGVTNHVRPDGPAGGWRSVRSFRTVLCEGIYPGIDVRYTVDAQGGPKYDIIVHPGADPARVRIRFSGADAMEVRDGAVRLRTRFGELVENVPLSFWEINGRRLPTAVVFEPDGEGLMRFAVEAAVPGARLVIDPTPDIMWATYFGSTGEEYVQCLLATDNDEVVALGNAVFSPGLATAGAYQTTANAGSDCLIAQFAQDGTLQWCTYWGGPGSESISAAAWDPHGDMMVCGLGVAPGSIATPGTHQTTVAGDWDAMLAKISPDGIPIWCTYYGGPKQEQGLSIAVDDDGNSFITGSTLSLSGIATPGAYLDSVAVNLSSRCYLAKFDEDGGLTWGSYFAYGPGAAGDYGQCVLLNDSGDPVLAGSQTSWPQFPPPPPDNDEDVFVSQWTTDGQLVWVTMMVGEDSEYVNDMVIDANGTISIVGWTESPTDIATPGAFMDAINNSDQDGFFAHFDPSGTLEYCTYWGTQDGCGINRLTSDGYGGYFFAGSVKDIWGFTTPGAYQTVPGGGSIDLFMARVDSTGNWYWRTYFGGESGNESTYDLLRTPGGDLVLLGITNSATGISTPGSHQPVKASTSDAFLARFSAASLGVQGAEGVLRTGVHPCPAVDGVFLEHRNAKNVLLFNELGQQQPITVISGTGQVSHVGFEVSSGLYILQYEADGGLFRAKVVVER